MSTLTESCASLVSDVSNYVPEDLLADPWLDIFPTQMERSTEANFGAWEYTIKIVGGEINGLLEDDKAYLSNIEVKSSFSHTGRGRYLVRAFAREMALRGATFLGSDIVSPGAMHNRLRVFGEHNLTLRERLLPGIVLPITGEQAVTSLKLAESTNPPEDIKKLLNYSPAFICEVDLTNQDVLRRIFTAE